MRASHLLIGVAMATVLAPVAASAQDVVMRRPLPMSQQAAGETDWRTTPWLTFDSSGNQVDPATACGLFTDKRQVTCEKPDGTVVGDYFCTKPKPGAEQSVRHDGGCTYSWDETAWADGGPACTLSKTQTRAVTCRRDGDQAPVADSFCAQPKPDTVQQVADYSTCSHSWKEGGYVDPGASCTLTERQEQTVTCVRDLDQQTVDPSKCNPATKPNTFQEVPDESGCTYRWDAGEYVDPGQSCTRSETQTRDVRCLSSLGDKPVDDAMCASAGAKPAASQIVPDYSNCQYTAVEWADGGWSSTCSANAVHTENAKCQRSNDGGEIVPGTECTSRGVDITRTTPGSNYSSCSNSWSHGDWAEGQALCTETETQTRAVWCKRDLDSAVQPDGACQGNPPNSTQVVPDYSGCSYYGGPWSSWSYASQCSNSTSMSRTRSCMRSDGTPADASQCTSRGIPLSETQTGQQNHAGCGYAWRASGFQDPGNSCGGNETWTQTAWCERTLDGETVADSFCNAGQKPALTDVRPGDYNACTYTPVYHGVGACDGTRRPHYWDCTRSDGTPGFPATMCGHTNPEFEACFTYQNVPQAQSCNGGTQTVVNRCMRSDGQEVDASFCNMPATSQQSCTSFQWNYSGWGAFGACGSNGIQTRSRAVWCEGNTGGNVVTVGDENCNAGLRPSATDTQSCTYYTYAWTAIGPTGWNSSCSTSAQRTQQYECRQSPGNASVAASNCSGGNPSYVETGENLAGCTYTPTYGSWSNCSGGQQSRSMTSCSRSDGASVATSFCTNAGHQATETQSCTPPAATISGYAYFGNLYMDIASKPFSGSRVETYRGGAADNSNGFDGMQCDYQLTISYNGETREVSGVGSPGYDGHMGYSGGCFTNIQYHTVGGRVFQISASSGDGSPYGYGDVTGRISISWP